MSDSESATLAPSCSSSPVLTASTNHFPMFFARSTSYMSDQQGGMSYEYSIVHSVHDDYSTTDSTYSHRVFAVGPGWHITVDMETSGHGPADESSIAILFYPGTSIMFPGFEIIKVDAAFHYSMPPELEATHPQVKTGVQSFVMVQPEVGKHIRLPSLHTGDKAPHGEVLRHVFKGISLASLSDLSATVTVTMVPTFPFRFLIADTIVEELIELGPRAVDMEFVLTDGKQDKSVYAHSFLLHGHSKVLDELMDNVLEGPFMEWEYEDDPDLQMPNYEDQTKNEAPPDSPVGIRPAETSSSPGSDASWHSASSEPPTLELSQVQARPVSPTANVRRINGVAHKTFMAVVKYLHTCEITFDDEDDPSAKSVYRLAERLGLQELQDKAMEMLKSQCAPENIVDEAFSFFTSHYPALLEVQVSYMRERLNAGDGVVCSQYRKALERLGKGDIPHAVRALELLTIPGHAVM
ncbi:hypothetical protein CYLTODRAFT_227045 [Cylindrobasidium torrendii FP15055 ss-10]|uniref:BTB domain-containing protein n=1 Tax=Cylindrobasidium torrendii FP15055 ss-10 TaxID=1314674 RepID=A0A0D7BH45_9AGAR|nr:hypothetical protein CYLTODRAFT_227045 [Cylindrobasidium torrendii FP15055 ss-10]